MAETPPPSSSSPPRHVSGALFFLLGGIVLLIILLILLCVFWKRIKRVPPELPEKKASPQSQSQNHGNIRRKHRKKFSIGVIKLITFLLFVLALYQKR